MSVITVSKFKQHDADINDEEVEINSDIVTPGELITEETVWMRGHGTYSLDNKTFSSVAGTILKVNRLLSVQPLKGRYTPETGDHVVGRIIDVGNKRWKVEIGSRSDAVLMLGSVNLPGGILRRKSDTDELNMRNLLKEGDLLNCEVQSLFQDGSASLHTRSLKYGKLRDGIFVSVPRSLIIRSKNHNFTLQGGVSVILGVNGFIWIYGTPVNVTSLTNSSSSTNKFQAQLSSQNSYKVGSGTAALTKQEEEASWEIYSDKNRDGISDIVKQNIVRYRNAIKALAHCEIGINEAKISAAYEATMAYGNLGTLIETEIMESVGNDVLIGEKMRGS